MAIAKKTKTPFLLCGPLGSLVRYRTGGEKEIATGTSRSTRDDHFDRAEDHEEVHDGDDLKREIEQGVKQTASDCKVESDAEPAGAYHSGMRFY